MERKINGLIVWGNRGLLTKSKLGNSKYKGTDQQNGVINKGWRGTKGQ